VTLLKPNVKLRVCSEIVIRCRNWLGWSELTFTAELCVLQRIWDSLPKLNCLQWICNSLPKLSWVQRINIHCRIVCSAANLGFATEVELSAAKFVIRCRNWIVWSELTFAAELCVLQRIWDSLVKLYWLQWICDSLLELSSLQRISICCWKTCWLQRSRIRCQNYSTSSETVFTAELCSLQRTSFRCRIVQPAASQFLLSISTIGLPGRNDSNACNNFIV
jgi:hypothetical protein